MDPKLITPITYYGGKKGLLHHILPLVPDHEVYTETFFGGGALFFAKEPCKNETINDKMDLLINFYRVLKNDFDKLHKLVDQTLYSRTQYNKALSFLRKGSKATPIQKAWAFFFQVNCGFAKKFQSAIAYSNTQSVSKQHSFYNLKSRFTRELQNRIEKVFIENTDALKVLRSRNVPNAFHYQDPPYPGADQGHYKGYGWDQYQNLLEFNQNECKGKFLLSNYHSPLLQEYVDRNGWNIKLIKHRITAPKTKNRDKIEVLVWNYNNTTSQPKLF